MAEHFAYGMHDFTTGSEVTHDQLMRLGQGLLGLARSTGDTTTDDAHATPLLQPVDVLDSRAVLVFARGRVQIETAGGAITGGIYCNGGLLCSAIKTFYALGDGQTEMFGTSYLHFPGAAGTYTYSLEFWRSAGTGHVTVLDDPAQLIIVDIHGVF